MAIDTSTLPEEVQQLIFNLKKENEIYKSYKKKYEDMRRMFLGRRSEKLHLPDDIQERLFNEPERRVAETTIEVKSYKRNKKKAKKERQPSIPEDAPVIEKRHDITAEEKLCPCCDQNMQQIGEDSCEEMHVIPEHIVVHKNIYPKYACPKCKEDAGVIAAKRNRFLPGTIVGSGLLAFIIQRKYQFGLPLNRISAMFKAFGARISRQNMSNWIISASEKLQPLHELLKKELLKSELIGIDETPMQVLNEVGRKDTTKSYMWHMRASPPDGPVSIFQYRASRSADFLKELLTDYGGVMLTDGWKSYDTLAKSTGLVHAGCWSHARRYFHKAYLDEPGEKVAEQILRLVRNLFVLEAAFDKRDGSRKKHYRRRWSRPVLFQIKQHLKKYKTFYPSTSRMGEAISYTRGQWKKLIQFLYHPAAMIHNNDVERGIRPFVIGRKNWTFAGCPNGAAASAMFYSLIESAKANNLNPYDYLTLLFEKWPLCQSEDEMIQLLPNRVTQDTIDAFFSEYGQV